VAFITFEGMDGAGKTSTSEAVAHVLVSNSYPVIFLDKKTAGLEHPYLIEHADTLRNLIWGYPSTAPIEGLGDPHWLHLMASWFYLIDETVVRPALATRKIVIVDSWAGKFLARFALKNTTGWEHARQTFSALTQPNLTLFLDVDPVVAAARKREFTIAECGNLDGYIGTTTVNFIAYQSRIQSTLREFSLKQNWQAIDTSNRSQLEVTEIAVSLILSYLNASESPLKP
jgi:dTMP kinase